MARRALCGLSVLCLFLGTAASASLAQMQAFAQQKTADWDRLAQNLEGSIAGLLPCDPKAAAAITEVSKASDARVAAVSEYLREASRQASLQTAAARRVLASVEPLGAELSAEKADLLQELAGVNAQIKAVTGSAQRRPAFDGPENTLKQIAALEQQRSDAADAGVTRVDPVQGAVRDIVTQLETREAALKDAQAAFETENALWSTYYTLRLARAQTECGVTKGLVDAPARPQGKQK